MRFLQIDTLISQYKSTEPVAERNDMICAKIVTRTLILITISGLVLGLLACGGDSGGTTGVSSGNTSAGGGTNNTSNTFAPAATVQLTASASRTTGVAPLGVFFNADVDTTTDSFHTLEYAWDFGDPGSGTWADSSASKNTDKGPVAAHIFESPGDFTVTLTVRDDTGIIATRNFDIQVDNPDTYYTGTDTVCISKSTSNDFTECPAGAEHILMDNIDELPNHVASGKRVLLRRGDSWTTSGSARYANIAGPVTIGAYGPCPVKDARGICDNAPVINLTGSTNQGIFNLYRITDWRIQDLHITGDTTRWGAIGGNTGLNSILLLKLKVEGFTVPMGNSHWDTDGHDQFMIVDCDISESATNEVYVGSERLVLMGNNFRNPGQSHVLRVWQAYFGVIGHNTLSGSSQDSSSGRHALKFHGPSQEVLANAGDGRGGLVNPSRFVVITDNIFGGSGPWPVCIAPQDTGQDERIHDIIVEKNRFFPGYGDQSCCSSPVQISLYLSARDITVRNNVFDGTNSSAYYTAIQITQRGIVPPPSDINVYNNTIYKSDLLSGYTSCRGIGVDAAATGTIIRNNLIHLPAATVVEMISNSSSDLISENNLMTDTPGLVAPDHADYLQKDFSLQAGSPAHNQGTSVPVWDDFNGTPRPLSGLYDIGAFEQ